VAGWDDRRGIAEISLGGIIVIVGIVLIFVGSFWIGLIAFGGFARAASGTERRFASGVGPASSPGMEVRGRARGRASVLPHPLRNVRRDRPF
jgi:hypothetical protein